jgi:hypothetical protein
MCNAVLDHLKEESFSQDVAVGHPFGSSALVVFSFTGVNPKCKSSMMLETQWEYSKAWWIRVELQPNPKSSADKRWY